MLKKYIDIKIWGADDIDNVERFYGEYREELELARQQGYINLNFSHRTKYDYGDESTVFYLYGDREETKEEIEERERAEKKSLAYRKAEFLRLKKEFGE